MNERTKDFCFDNERGTEKDLRRYVQTCSGYLARTVVAGMFPHSPSEDSEYPEWTRLYTKNTIDEMMYFAINNSIDPILMQRDHKKLLKQLRFLAASGGDIDAIEYDTRFEPTVKGFQEIVINLGLANPAFGIGTRKFPDIQFPALVARIAAYTNARMTGLASNQMLEEDLKGFMELRGSFSPTHQLPTSAFEDVEKQLLGIRYELSEETNALGRSVPRFKKQSIPCTHSGCVGFTRKQLGKVAGFAELLDRAKGRRHEVRFDLQTGYRFDTTGVNYRNINSPGEDVFFECIEYFNQILGHPTTGDLHVIAIRCTGQNPGFKPLRALSSKAIAIPEPSNTRLGNFVFDRVLALVSDRWLALFSHWALALCSRAHVGHLVLWCRRSNTSTSSNLQRKSFLLSPS
jgi:hypothetical protein